MGLAGPEAVEFLAGVLASGEFEGRKLDQRAMVYVVNSLSSVGDPRAAKALLGAAAGKDAHVAGYAARALGRCVDVEMTEDIIEAWSGAARGTPRTRIEEALKSGKYPVTWDVEKRTFVLDAERLKAMREGMKRKGTEEERPRGAEPF